MGVKWAVMNAMEKDILRGYASGEDQNVLSEKFGITKLRIKTILTKFGEIYGKEEVWDVIIAKTGKGKTRLRKLTIVGEKIIEGWRTNEHN